MALYRCSSPPGSEDFGSAIVVEMWLNLKFTGGSGGWCEGKFLWSSPGGREIWLSPGHFPYYINLSSVTKTQSETVISCKRFRLTFNKLMLTYVLKRKKIVKYSDMDLYYAYL